VVGDIAKAMGLRFHPWQRHRAEVCGELVRVRGRTRLAASTTLTMVGRQAGKTTAVTADVATRCLAPDLPSMAALVGHRIGPQHVAMTAQDRIAALRQWYEHVEMMMASPIAGSIDKVVRKNGEECVHFRNGSKYRVVTPSRTGARGLALDMVVIDEALAHEPWLLDVMGPTMAQRDGATVSYGAQLVIVSNAGDETAVLLNQQRELGRRAVAEGDRGYVLLEWSCADDADVLDPATWRATIPTLDVPDGLASAWLARQAEQLGTDAFAREYLCRMVVSERRKVLDLQAWDALPYLEARGDLVFALEVSPDRTGAVIVACGPWDNAFGIELVEERFGTEWVVPRLKQLAGTSSPVVLDRFGPAAALQPALEKEEMEVVSLTSTDVTDAAGLFIDLIDARRIGHARDMRMADSVMGLARRQRGDRWCFDRYEGHPLPIIAASMAVWRAQDEVAQVKVW
jgi:hypothetical protein